MARSCIFEPGWQFFALRRMNSLSAAGQAQKRAKWADFHILSLGGHFNIAPYEQFISGLPSVEGAKWPDRCILSLDCNQY